MAWATTDEATGYVGVAVSSEQLATAQPVIDIWSGLEWTVNFETTRLKSRDLYLLKLAVSYQAKWMADQIDVLNRTDVESVTQDGMSFKNAHVDAQLLAPMAKRALDRVSWRKARTINPTPSKGYRRNASLNDDESCWDWRPMR